jgi:uroporphyrinogen decarboxylase
MGAFPKIESDYSELDRVFRRRVPDRVPAIELFADHEFIEEVLGYGPNAIASDRDYADWQRYWLWRIDFQKVTAPDSINVGIPWLVYEDRKVAMAKDTAPLPRDARCWVNESDGVITDREAFERYPWPDDEGVGQRAAEFFDFIAENLPTGMGMIVTSSGVLEWTMWLMGYQPLCFALHEDPDLVRAVTERIGKRFLEGYTLAARHEAVRALWLGDDMGFKTAPMISPEHLREYIFPWQQRMAEAAHAEGKPFLIHACGQLELVMDDLIDSVGIDGKHSFEDVIMPVPVFKQKYGHRIAVLGGADVDVLARHTPDEVRQYTRMILDACAPGGGFAMGTGNSVTNYIPVENYAAMLEELADFNGSQRQRI